MDLIISEGLSRKETDWKPRRISWDALCLKLQKAVRTSETEAQYAAMSKDERVQAKDVGGFVGGELTSKRRRGLNVAGRQILALDVDYGTSDFIDSYDLLGEWACFIHTTHSHTHENPRFRMLFPLLRSVSPEEYEAIGRKIASIIGIEMFDKTTFEPSRLMFWPSVCKDGEYLCRKYDGEWINPDDILAMYNDWKNISEWPKSARETKDIKSHTTGSRLVDPRQKDGLIGAFCDSYDIPAAIEKYLPDVYVPTDRPDRYTYKGGSTYGGLVLYEADVDRENSNGEKQYMYAFSHHDTDPCSGREVNAYDLVRLHKFPDLDDKASMEAMKTLLAKDDKVMSMLDLRMSQHADALFADDDPADALRRDEYDLTESGNALRLRDSRGRQMRYNPSLGWCIWDRKQWYVDDEAKARLLIMLQNDDMLREAEKVLQVTEAPPEGTPKTKWPEDYARAMARFAWAKASRGYTNMNHTLQAAQSIMEEPSVDIFDQNPWELNTPDGIYDLRSGERSPHSAAHMCTMITSVKPDFYSPKPLYDAFLDQITQGDKDLQNYLQEIAGMALVGHVYMEGLVMAYGPGANGKSTLFETWLEVVGSYGLYIRPEVLLGTKSGAEVAGRNQLRGKRLVVTSELEERSYMTASLMKQMTSRDKISANVKYHEPITFTPSHTLVLHTNHLPRLQSFDEGTRRRIAIAPFKAQIPPEKRIMDLTEQLVTKEGGAILAWMIRGAMRFYANGKTVKKPACVIKETKDYIDNEDRVQRFISECCVTNKDAKVSSAQLFSSFKEWLKDEGLLWAGGSVSFRKSLTSKGYEYKRTTKGVVVCGLDLDLLNDGTDDL